MEADRGKQLVSQRRVARIKMPAIGAVGLRVRAASAVEARSVLPERVLADAEAVSRDRELPAAAVEVRSLVFARCCAGKELRGGPGAGVGEIGRVGGRG